MRVQEKENAARGDKLILNSYLISLTELLDPRGLREDRRPMDQCTSGWGLYV
jgi:hypothetical protein